MLKGVRSLRIADYEGSVFNLTASYQTCGLKLVKNGTVTGRIRKPKNWMYQNQSGASYDRHITRVLQARK